MPRVALESTLLLHGVPRESCLSLHAQLCDDVRGAGAEPALIAVFGGESVVGVSACQLEALLSSGTVPKANTSNLGVLLARKAHAATTVSTTMELAARAGIRVFATGGLGGVHQGWSTQLDVSSDLLACTRFPVAVVCSGVKSILDVRATREALETLGVPVVGFRTGLFPAFYQRSLSEAGPPTVDATFDDVEELAAFVHAELARTGRGIVVCNPIPEDSEIPAPRFEAWKQEALRMASEAGATGRDATPFVLGRLHAISNGETLRANIALVRSNARLAGAIAAAMPA
jgi:pseudouridine-5'-phosphate glycosidase